MQSFIVTFYRRGGDENPDLVLGTIEEAGVTGEKQFTCLGELYGFFDGVGERKKKGSTRERGAKGGPRK